MSSTIAHKEMKPGGIQDEDDSDSEDSETIGSPVQDFEPISPVNNNGTTENTQTFEPISPNGSPINNDNPITASTTGHFENISDDENEDENEDHESISDNQNEDHESISDDENEDQNNEDTNKQITLSNAHDDVDDDDDDFDDNHKKESKDDEESTSQTVLANNIDGDLLDSKDNTSDQLTSTNDDDIENKEPNNVRSNQSNLDNDFEFNDNDSDISISSTEKKRNDEVELLNENDEQVSKYKDTESDDIENNEINMEKDEDQDIDTNDVEPPIPSPFSDIGDVDDIADSNLIMNDILKEHDEILKENENDKRTFDIDDLEIAENDKTNYDEGVNLEKESDEISNGNENKDESVPVEVNSESKSDNEDEGKADIDETSDDAIVKEKKDVDEASEANEEKEMEEEEESQEDAGDLIADIFGDSDEEEGEFEGFTEEDLPPVRDEELEEEMKSHNKKEQDKKGKEVESEEDEEIPDTSFVSDFDIMLENKKKANRLKRKSKKDYDVCGDNDDIIAAMIRQMKDAAEEDRMLNQCGKAATKKLKMLPSVISHLRKADIQATLIDCGVLPAMKEWLTPLPDHALPHVNIRRLFLKMLTDFPPLDKGALKVSGIGRAVMLLFKHPKELPENKRMAGKIISNWARPIFNVTTNYNEMSREDRESRDKVNIPESKRRKLSSEDVEVSRKKFDDEDDDKLPQKPGDKGWIARARVPQPSHRDYVNRPQSKVENYEFQNANVKTKVVSRFDKTMRKLKDKKSDGSKVKKAVSISLNGSKMSL